MFMFMTMNSNRPDHNNIFERFSELCDCIHAARGEANARFDIARVGEMSSRLLNLPDTSLIHMSIKENAFPRSRDSAAEAS